MNRRAVVPTCPECHLAPAADGPKLACLGCGQVLEDFSPPRKREVMYRKLRWEEGQEGGWRLWFRDVMIAHCGEKIYSEWEESSTRMVEISREGYYHLIDSPMARVLGLTGGKGALRVTFPDARGAVAALRARVRELAQRRSG